jgi:hypothetical protein
MNAIARAASLAALDLDSTSADDLNIENPDVNLQLLMIAANKRKDANIVAD